MTKYVGKISLKIPSDCWEICTKNLSWKLFAVPCRQQRRKL